MPQFYDEQFKKNIVRLRIEEGRSIKSLVEEYGVLGSSVKKWCGEFNKECLQSPEIQKERDSMEETLRLRKENEELRKENLFLKISQMATKLPLHSLQRKSIRGLPIYPKIWFRIWRQMVAATP